MSNGGQRPLFSYSNGFHPRLKQLQLVRAPSSFRFLGPPHSNYLAKVVNYTCKALRHRTLKAHEAHDFSMGPVRTQA